jgi:hypothetical protein
MDSMYPRIRVKHVTANADGAYVALTFRSAIENQSNARLKASAT